MTRLKELNFIVSLVGKYYTVVGQDRNETIIENRVYHSSNCMIVSPANDFSETFIILCEEIETSFKGYRFIPFCIYSQIIEGLNVRYTDEKLNTIYHALFNNHFKDLNISIIGDKDYKLEDWIFEDYIETIESWTIYPPNQDIE